MKTSDILASAIQVHQSGDLRLALSLYDIVLLLDKTNIDALHNAAIGLSQLGFNDAAYVLLKKTLVIYPDHGNITSTLDKLCAIKKTKNPDREVNLDHVKDKSTERQTYELPDSTLVLLTENLKEEVDMSVVECYLREKFSSRKWDDVCLLAKLNLRMSAKSQFLWKSLGAAELQRGRPRYAITPMMIAVELNPNDTTALNNLANAFRMIKNFSKSKKYFEEALRLDKNNYVTMNNYAVLYQDMGRDHQAEQLLLASLRITTERPQAYNNLGNIYLNRGEKSIAMEYYQKSLRLKSDDWSIHNNIGVLLRERGDLKGALSAYLKSLEYSPNNTEVLNNIGVIYLDANQIEKAEETLKTALRLDQKKPELYLNIASVYREQGRYTEAVDALDTAIFLKNEWSEAYNNRGIIKMHMRRHQLSIDDYLLAIKFNPKNSVAISNLLFCYNYCEFLNTEQLYEQYKKYAQV